MAGGRAEAGAVHAVGGSGGEGSRIGGGRWDTARPRGVGPGRAANGGGGGGRGEAGIAGGGDVSGCSVGASCE